MSEPSGWILNNKSTRCVVPQFILKGLAKNPLSSTIYLTSMGFYRSAYGHSMERLTHTDWLVLYCVDGLGYMEVKNKSYIVGKNTLVILPKGVTHRYHADVENPWSIYWFHFLGHNADAILQFIHKNDEASKVIYLRPDTGLVSDFEAIIAFSKGPLLLDNFIYASLSMHKLLGYIGLLNRDRSSRSINTAKERFRTFMLNNIEKNMSLDQMAEQFDMSKFNFSRYYKKVMGQTPMANFVQLKIQKACQYIDLHQMTVKEISYKLGFSDPLYFRKVFKKVMGFTPGEYKKMKNG